MLLITYGTRPEWIKIKPLVEELRERNVDFKILFTGQHDNFFDGECDYALIEANNSISRLNNIFSGILASKELEDLNPDWVLVQGDTASVCAIAIKYYNLGKNVIHLEAGLRTYDLKNPCPEEAYRQMVSRISSLHLCPMEENLNHLRNEMVSGSIHVVGNTVLDNLKDIETSYQDKVLVTLHRRENISIMKEWFHEINELAKNNPEIEFLLPIHPNPVIKSLAHLLPNVKVVDPLSHDELVDYMRDCKLIITDSGGIQEEATFLEKRILVCRKETERNNEVGNISLIQEPKQLLNYFNYAKEHFEISIEACPYGDGQASKKIADIFENMGII